MTEPKVQHNRDGSTTVTLTVPPAEADTRSLDAAFDRMTDFEGHDKGRWYFVSLQEPSHSYGYIAVLEKRGETTSMSGGAGLAAAVAGFGFRPDMAIDDAIARARAWDAGIAAMVNPLPPLEGELATDYFKRVQPDGISND